MLLQRHPPSFLSRTVCGWQRLSPTTGGRALLLAISVVVLQQLSMATAQEFQCPDGQVVLEFAGEIPDVFFEDYTAFNVSVTSSAAAADLDDDEDIFKLVQSWPNAASMEPLCVPADKCLTVQIHINEPYRTTNLPTDFSIVYDGTTFSPRGPFPPDNFEAEEQIDYYMQVGASCEVTCDEDQLLLEIEGATGWAIMYDWQVIDESTNKVIRACVSHRNSTYQRGCYWSADSWYRDRVCVPKSGCHRFVAGRGALDSRTILQLTFDGEIVLQSDYFVAESLRLQHPESPSSCWTNTSACQSAADPSLVEMEIFIAEKWGGMSVNSSLTWYANYYVSEQLIYNQGTADFTGRPLQYNRICIPNCAVFSYDYVSDESFPEHNFQVRADGIIFTEGHRNTFGLLEEPKSSYIVGSSCRASRYCEEGGQSLVQVGIRYDPQFPLIPDLTMEWWTVAYASSLKEEKFRGEKSYLSLEDEEIGIGYPKQNGVGTPALQPGKNYRWNFCLSDGYFQDGSNTGCTVLDMHLEDEHAPAYSYHVSVNGEFFGDRIDCSHKVSLRHDVLCHWLRVVDNPTPSILTPLNGNCKMKGIPGYIAGGTVMGFLLIAGLGYYWIKWRRVAASKESNDVGIESSQIPASASVGQTADVAGE